MGLDPPTLTTLSPLLHRLTQSSSPRLILALRPQDLLPEWITHLIYLGPGLQVARQGPKESVLEWLRKSEMENLKPDRSSSEQKLWVESQPTTLTGVPKYSEEKENGPIRLSRDGIPLIDKDASKPAHESEPLIEMENIQIKYREKQVLGGWTELADGRAREGLWWTVKRGERWGIFGPNGNVFDVRVHTRSGY